KKAADAAVFVLPQFPVARLDLRARQKALRGRSQAGAFRAFGANDGQRKPASLQPVELKGADSMKKVVLSIAAAFAVSAAVPAFAADMPVKAPAAAPAAAPSPWDIAFGAAVMNDYIFRGITQSGHKPSVA